MDLELLEVGPVEWAGREVQGMVPVVPDFGGGWGDLID